VSRRLRLFWLSLTTRGGKVLAASVAAVGAIVLYLLSGTHADMPTFAQGLPQLLLVGLGVVLLLMLLTGYQLLTLRRRLRQRVFGSKLSLRLVLLCCRVHWFMRCRCSSWRGRWTPGSTYASNAPWTAVWRSGATCSTAW
jgi:hypothetical protein